jgi:hypothetical protein
MHLFNSIQTNGRTPRYYSPGKLVFAFVLTCLLFKQLDGSIIHSKISTQLKFVSNTIKKNKYYRQE